MIIIFIKNQSQMKCLYNKEIMGRTVETADTCSVIVELLSRNCMFCWNRLEMLKLYLNCDISLFGAIWVYYYYHQEQK